MMTRIDFKPVRRCGKCNHLIPADLNDCPYCHGEEEPTSYPRHEATRQEVVKQTERQPMDPKTKKRLLAMGGIALLAIIAGVLIWHFIANAPISDDSLELAEEEVSVVESRQPPSDLVVSSHISMCINLYKDRDTKDAFFQALQYNRGGSDEVYDYWARGFSFNLEDSKPKGVKPSSSLVMLSKTSQEVLLVFFDNKVLNEARKSLEGLLYKRVDDPNDNVLETYTNANTSFPIVEISEESDDNNVVYLIHFCDNKE